MYGNYCGPYWSAGRFQSSVDSDIPAVDDVDLGCKIHDTAYARGDDLAAADRAFAQYQIGRGVYGTIAGGLVGAQGILRDIGILGNNSVSKVFDNSIPVVTSNKTNNMNLNKNFNNGGPRLRGATQKSSKFAPHPNSRGGTKREMATSMPNFSTAVAPVNTSVRVNKTSPKIVSSKGNVVVSNREYVGYVANSTSFTLTPYACNPGLSNLFPWLSNIANSYDRYRFKRLQFLFISSTSTATTGRLAMVWNYNAADPPPTTKAGALSIAPAVECNSWSSTELNVPVTGLIHYTRDGMPNTIDIKTTDMGALYIVTDLGANTNTIGELYIQYEIEFMNPHANIPPFTELYSTSSAITNVFPVATTRLGTDRVGDTLVSNTIRFNATGRYLVTWVLVGTGSPVLSTWTVQDGGTFSSAVTNIQATNTTTSLIGLACYDVTVDPAKGFTEVLAAFTGTTITKTYLLVNLVDSGVTPVFGIA